VLRYVYLIGLFACFAACGGESGAPAASAPAAKASAAKPEATVDPCAILDADLIRRHFDVGGEELSVRPSKVTHHPLCAVTWRKPNADEIEKDLQKKMTEYALAKAKGEDVKMPAMKTDNRVTLTINMPPLENEESAASSFESAMRTLEEGFKDKDNPDAPPRFRYDTEPVGGVADQASWTPGLSQLSARSGLYIFHVTVEVGDAERNQAKAKEISTDVAAALE